MKFSLLLSFGLIFAVFSCKSSSDLKNNDTETTSEADLNSGEVRSDNWLQLQLAYAKKREQETDFYADGRDWDLSIDEDKAILFNSDIRGIHYHAPATKGLQPQDLNAIIYNVISENGSLSIRLTPDSCTNQKSERMPYSVNISLKNEAGEISTFEGCGLYLNNPVLNDIWALKSWSRSSGDSLPNSTFPGNPQIEINLQTNKVYGNLGCGDITGFISPKGNRLKIYNLDYTNSTHDCDSKIARDLFDYLNFKDNYVSLDGLRLRLATDSDTLVFQKVD